MGEADVEALAERVARLEAAEAARELTAAYALALDTKDLDALAALFTEDAVLHAGPRTLRGREAVVGFFRDALLADPGTKKHLIMNHRVTHPAPGEVRVESYFMYTSTGPESVLGWGGYSDLVRVAGGSARFAEKRIVVDVAADVRTGWAGR
ncbi:3-phenylpropionate/cinnamic acid dioxygenase small subunit [Thermocatellispora tengchongensis]|uniref:3-phenylpropionate/cinnamic acid dioxygenase small subunit n=1 Tax=Thermocatellispora tengchongensis TaxID=1073253 RepID=A0A840PHB0_9ACTN|nr:nuclear transport factor 2 family protein [Thermocatellispora tengchongensis]MBB5138948.1 3-phenylpropionate/cinnamic acid dioxygenase small subunit [Thermocatellispora tengchongensis]